MDEIKPDMSLRIVGGIGGYPLNMYIKFVQLIRSNRLHSVWLANVNSEEIIAKVAAPKLEHNAYEGINGIKKWYEKPRHISLNDELLWLNGYGVFYDSALFRATPQAKGLEMIPEDWAFRSIDENLPNEIIQWQASEMNKTHGVFPRNIDCYEIEGGRWCLVQPFLKAKNLAQIMYEEYSIVPGILLKLAVKHHVLHSTWGYHQDLKPEHVLISSDGDITLIDPGFRKLSEQKKTLSSRFGYPDKMFITTPRYYPLFRYSLDDCQAMAVIIYEWLVKKHPFDGRFWDDFPKTIDDRSVPEGGAYTEDELWLSRMGFVNSIPRFEDKIPEPWWNLLLDLLRFRISMEETALRIMDIMTKIEKTE